KGNAAAPESCDMKDNDCNGTVDDNIPVSELGCPLTNGVCGAAMPMRTCMDGVLVPSDCSEGCPGENCLYGPDYVLTEGGVTGCGDNLDNDCDNDVDEDCQMCTP